MGLVLIQCEIDCDSFSVAVRSNFMYHGRNLIWIADMQPDLAQLFCDFPVRLHPVSQLILDYYNDGVIGIPEFMRYFSLPNSNYIELAHCYITMVTGSPPFA